MISTPQVIAAALAVAGLVFVKVGWRSWKKTLQQADASSIELAVLTPLGFWVYAGFCFLFAGAVLAY